MSYNGSGTFQINTSGQPVVAGTVISSTAFNALTADLATGLSTAITKDGQTATTVRIPFAQGISSTLTTDSSSVSTGSIITAGGVGIVKNLYVGANANIAGTLGVTGVATFSAAPIYSSLTASSAVATDASKALVSVTNTGTGNNVLATAPTIASANLTTALTLTGAAGTSGQLLTSQGTGVAPIWSTVSSDTVGFKNRIINGAMVIDARNAGASVTATTANFYNLDRWQNSSSVNSKFSIQQNAAAVTPPTGFLNYLGVTSLSAYSILAGDFFSISQPIEGFNTADLGFGTASASTVTLSFWVRSSLTGTFGGVLRNAAGNRGYPFTYTINAANTWEYETITIAGDTTGTWVGATNGIGINVYFGLGVGSTYSGTAGAWGAANLISATGATSVVGTNGATWYVTGVQLEKGSTATSFDYRPIGTELALCQRYYESSYDIGTAAASATTTGMRLLTMAVAALNSGMGQVSFLTPKRATPTILTYDGAGTVNNVSTAPNNTTLTNGRGYTGAPFLISTTGFSHQGQGGTGNVYNYVHFTSSSEL
jgi:hypothetical protein